MYYFYYLGPLKNVRDFHERTLEYSSEILFFSSRHLFPYSLLELLAIENYLFVLGFIVKHFQCFFALMKYDNHFIIAKLTTFGG